MTTTNDETRRALLANLPLLCCPRCEGDLDGDDDRLVCSSCRQVFPVSFLDPNLRGKDLGSEKRRAWFRDQYGHPHESKHTVGEVIGWLERTGLRFVKSLPPSKPFQPVSETEALFEPEEPGNRLERLAAELGMILRGSREGGFFVVIARKIARPE